MTGATGALPRERIWFGGLAVITGVEAWAWLLILTLLFLFGGAGGLLYILLWIFVPLE